MTDNETMIIDAFAELPSDRREITLAACVAIDRVLGRREKKAREDFGSALEEHAREHPQSWVDAASLNRAENGTEITLPVTRGTEDAYDLPMTVEATKEYVAKPLAPEIDPKETEAAIAQGNVMASPASVWIIGDKKFTIENTADTLAPDFKFQTMAELAEIEKARAAAIAQQMEPQGPYAQTAGRFNRSEPYCAVPLDKEGIASPSDAWMVNSNPAGQAKAAELADAYDLAF